MLKHLKWRSVFDTNVSLSLSLDMAKLAHLMSDGRWLAAWHYGSPMWAVQLAPST